MAPIESLESRIAPATFVVSSLAPVGENTLAKAIDQANALPGPDTITFAATGTVFTNATLTITDEVTIKASKTVTIDGSNHHQLFDLQGDGSARFENLIITRGFSIDAAGGGIGSSGFDLKLVHCTVSANESTGDGGGIAVDGAHLTLLNSKVKLNIASNGGGIAMADGTLTAINSQISRNIAGQQNIAAGNGGEILLVGASAKLSNSVISGNTAASEASYGGLGGGIYAAGNTYVSSSYGESAAKLPIVLSGTKVTKNVASQGGGIYYNGDEMKLKLISSVVTGNTRPNVFKYKVSYDYA